LKRTAIYNFKSADFEFFFSLIDFYILNCSYSYVNFFCIWSIQTIWTWRKWKFAVAKSWQILWPTLVCLYNFVD